MTDRVTTDVLVLGLGAFGSAACYQAARRGATVVGIDRFAPPHDRGSSHGETRITREAVGEGEDYVPLVRRSHAIWRELEAATGRELFVACGALVFASGRAAGHHHGKDRFVERSTSAARRFGIAHEVLDATAIAARFPHFGLVGDEHGYFEPGGGFVRPEACIAAQLDEARRHGAAIRTGERVLGVTSLGDGAAVETDRGRIVARRVIACVGAWTGGLLASPFAPLLAVNRQRLWWFAPREPAAYAPERCPVYIWMHGARDIDYFYGFPMVDGVGGVKVATEQYEQACDPDDLLAGPSGDVIAAGAAAMHAEHLDGRLRGITSRVVKTADCFYTVTPDRGFIVDRHPDVPAMTVVSACSGHGFKHSAGLGEAVALAALDIGGAIDLAPFALARFAATEAIAS